MKIAIVGLGVIGKLHYSALRSLGENITALCDVDSCAMAEYEGVRKYTDYKTMLDKEDIDAVHICTPHYLHADMIIEALGRGVNVLSEKPLCIREEDIGRILEAEKNSTARLGVCFQNRYNKSYRYVKEYLKDKKVITAFANVVWRRDKAYYGSAEWRGKWDTEGGGTLINQAIHTLDFTAWVLGMPSEVTAMTANLTLQDAIEVEDTAFAIFSGDSDFSFASTNGQNSDFAPEVLFKLEDGNVRLYGDKVFVNDTLVDFSEEQLFNTKSCYGNGHASLFADYYDAIRCERPFDIDGEEGAKAVRLVLSIYKSQGKKINVI